MVLRIARLARLLRLIRLVRAIQGFDAPPGLEHLQLRGFRRGEQGPNLM